jgi:uncharacterized protein YceK
MKLILLIMVLFLLNGCFSSYQEQLEYEGWHQKKQDEAKRMFDTVPDVSYNFGT